MKFIFVFIGLLALATACTSRQSLEERYQQKDNLLRKNYEEQTKKLDYYFKTMPEKRDSLQQVLDSITQETFRKHRKLVLRYADTYCGIKDLFAIRNQIPKDKLKKVFEKIPQTIQYSEYGKLVFKYIYTKQIAEGDALYYFPALKPDGQMLDWPAIRGKQVLLLYGGIQCMGEEGRQALAELCRQTSREDLLVVIYQPTPSLEMLQKFQEEFPGEYIYVTDFREDESPLKIVYGAQATPTCFLTDKQHIIRVACIGLQTDKFKPFIQTRK